MYLGLNWECNGIQVGKYGNGSWMELKKYPEGSWMEPGKISLKDL